MILSSRQARDKHDIYREDSKQEPTPTVRTVVVFVFQFDFAVLEIIIIDYN
jgi:hypothetical protein